MNKKKLGTGGLPIPVVDIFAGPGGLGEGFTQAGNGVVFETALSIEMNKQAHRTLRLRAFQRNLVAGGRLPEELIRVATGDIGDHRLGERFPAEWANADREALRYELGPDNAHVFRELRNRLGSRRLRDGRWILIGGPPCQAYSIAGRARKSRDKRAGDYRPEDDKRHFLYRNYLEILARFKPAVFVMENVKGMLSSKVSGLSMFEKILGDLRYPGRSTGHGESSEYEVYSVSTLTGQDGCEVSPASFIVESELYGVPQRRHRVIIVGIRSDFACRPECLVLDKAKKAMGCREAIQDLPRIRSRLSRRTDSLGDWLHVIADADWRFLLGLGSRGVIPEASRPIFEAVAAACKNLLGLSNGIDSVGGIVLERPGRGANGSPLGAWYGPENSRFVFNHEARAHMDSDLHRYMYMAAYAGLTGGSLKLAGFPIALLPNHQNVFESIRTRALFDDRFRVQVPSEPATTVTSHIAKDGHGYIHYDPAQCRTLTVREVARLQTFPDDYVFCGTRTDQYRQVGNAVPPFLAYQIANSIARATGLREIVE